MATKCTFIFQSGVAGWSETYYLDLSPAPALVTELSDAFWRGFFAPRGVSTTCKAVRISDPNQPRAGTIVQVNKRRSNLGMTVTDVNDDPPSMAAELTAAAAGTRRKIIVRGLRDYAYARDSAGVFNPDATIRAHFTSFANAIIDRGFTIRRLLPSGGLNVNRPIVTLSANDALGKTTLVTHGAATEQVPIGTRVIFHGLPPNLFPGLRAVTPVVASANGSFVAPVRWTGPTASVSTPGATWRIASYDYSGIVSAVLADLREHRTGRPSDLSRGRRSATVYRSR